MTFVNGKNPVPDCPDLILQHLQQSQPMSIKDLHSAIGKYCYHTVFDHTKELRESGKIEKVVLRVGKYPRRLNCPVYRIKEEG